MKNVNIKLATVLLIAGFGASAAFAQTPPEPPKGNHGDRAAKMQERIWAQDKDGDGKLSRAEAAALPRLAKHFDEIDTNKDGFITKEEMKAFHEKRAANRGK
ncbi:MAG: EF-hand domain-containing protein [Betaproteobacteria bacterium]